MDISSKAKMYFPLAVILVVGLLCGCGSPAPAATSPDEPPDSPEITTPLPNEPSEPPEATTPPDKPLGPPDRVDVVYFHRSKPCHCMAVVGDNIKYTVETYFKDELASGKLTFKMLTSNDKANAEMVKKYNSPPFGLFISVVRGKTESIYHVAGIWDLMADDQKLIEFVKSTIEKSLKGEA